MPEGQMGDELRECVSNCMSCHATCLEAAARWLSLGNKHSSPQHQRLLHDCAEACLASAHFMLRMSTYHASYCALCAEICKACAEMCEQLANGDEMTEICAAHCRRCEQSCRSMSHTVPLGSLHASG